MKGKNREREVGIYPRGRRSRGERMDRGRVEGGVYL